MPLRRAHVTTPYAFAEFCRYRVFEAVPADAAAVTNSDSRRVLPAEPPIRVVFRVGARRPSMTMAHRGGPYRALAGSSPVVTIGTGETHYFSLVVTTRLLCPQRSLRRVVTRKNQIVVEHHVSRSYDSDGRVRKLASSNKVTAHRFASQLVTVGRDAVRAQPRPPVDRAGAVRKVSAAKRSRNGPLRSRPARASTKVGGS